MEFLLVFMLGFSTLSVTMTEDSRIIYIDPGHGGADGGCVGSDGFEEKNINLAIAFELRDILLSLGYGVELTRIGDYDLASKNANDRKHEDILKRVAMMDSSLLYISIHCNYYLGEARGAQTFFGKDNGKELAEAIQSNIIKVLQNTNREVLKIQDKYILDNVKAPGCLVEVGFLSDHEELFLLEDKEYQRTMAYAIAIGICEYLKNL